MSDPDPQAANAFIREVWGLQGAAYAVLALRYIAQVTSRRSFAWDDFLMFIATLAYTAESVAAYYVVAYWKGLANSGMTPEEREALDPSSPEWALRVNGSKTHVIGLLLYTTVLWLLKGCWVIYYKRLTGHVRNERRIVFWSGIIIPVTYVSCLLVAFLKCIPFEKQWQIYPKPPNSCMPAISYIQTIYVMVMNTMTDFYLMAIPIPMIYEASLPLMKKAFLLVMFTGGFLEMTFGILRAASILTVGDTDPAQSGYWSVRESFVYFVLTNMPMVYPLFKRFRERCVSAASHSQHTGLGSNQDYCLDSQHCSVADHQYKRNRNSDIDPTLDTVVRPETKWGSEECVVAGTKHKGTKSTTSGEPSQQCSEIVGRGAPIPLYINPYGAGHEVTANASTVVQGSGGAVKGKDGSWIGGSGHIIVTTEFSVDEEAALGQRQGDDCLFRSS